jgi:sugar phosphate permease
MAYALLLAFLLRDGGRESDGSIGDAQPKAAFGNPFKGLRILLSNPSFWVILLYFAIPSLPGWAVKNWLPTLFAENLGIDMTKAGPLSTIAIAGSSLLGVIVGGILSDRWVSRNLKGRVYTSAIGLALTVPAILFIGLGHGLFSVLSAAVFFGFGFGVFDANNMPILCQFVSQRHRATGYGLMNMVGVFAGAFITDWLGKSSDAGSLGRDFAMMAVVVLFALAVQLLFLKPKSHDFVESR